MAKIAKKKLTPTNKTKLANKVEAEEKENTSSEYNLSFADEENSSGRMILLCGLSKCGRSQFATTFPKPVVYNTDKGLAAIKKHFPVLTINRSDNPHMKKLLIKLIRDIRDKKDIFANPKIYPETLIIDTITSISDFLEDEIKNYPPDGKNRNDGPPGDP